MVGLSALVLSLATGLAPVQAPVDPATDQAAIRQAVLDYAEGYYDHAPDRMERAISPLLTKRALMAQPGVAPFLLQMNAEMLIEATRGTAQRPAAADRHMTVEVLDVTGDIASARVFSVLFNDYIHLVKRGGKWQLVSVLWHQPPAAPGAAAPAAVEQAVRDYVAALAGSDGQRVQAMLSPVAAIRGLVTAPSGAKIVADQNAESIAAAVASGRMPKAPAPPTPTVLGVDSDIASAKVVSANGTTYLHLAAMQGGKWLVVNTLTMR